MLPHGMTKIKKKECYRLRGIVHEQLNRGVHGVYQYVRRDDGDWIAVTITRDMYHRHKLKQLLPGSIVHVRISTSHTLGRVRFVYESAARMYERHSYV